MFRSLIEELYFDNSCIGEKIHVSKTFNELFEKFEDYTKKLSDGLNEEQGKLLSELVELHFDLEMESEFAHYREGMRFGFRLATEVFNVQLKEERKSFIINHDE